MRKFFSRIWKRNKKRDLEENLEGLQREQKDEEIVSEEPSLVQGGEEAPSSLNISDETNGDGEEEHLNPGVGPGEDEEGSPVSLSDVSGKNKPVPMISVVSQDWAAKVVFSTLRKKLTQQSIRFVVFLFVLLVVIGGGFLGTRVLLSKIEHGAETKILDLKSKIADYQESGQRVRDCRAFADLINTPPLETQISPLATICIQNNFIVREIQFSDTLTKDIQSSISENFLLDSMGRSLDSVKVHGQWRLDLLIQEDASGETGITSNWVIDTTRKLRQMWEPVGYDVYVALLEQRQVVPGWRSVQLAVLIWK